MIQDCLYIGNQRLLVRLAFGGYVVVPTWNVDVGVGMARDGVIEPWTTAAVKALLSRGLTYVNVGANFGYYTVLGAYLVERRGKVFSIEANPHLIPDLIRSIYWSGFPDIIRLYQCAVAEEADRTLKLSFDPQFIGGGSVQGQSDGNARETPDARPPRLEDCFWTAEKVPRMKVGASEISNAPGFLAEVEVQTDTLDRVLTDVPEVDLLHMDIEGSEPAAILGARRMISRSPDLSIIMEWSPAYAAGNVATVRDMYAFLSNEGFQFYALDPAAFDPAAPFPACTPVSSLEELMQTHHCDLVCMKSRQAHAFGLSS
jgi:FkbM family methyltransferase